MSTRYLVAAYSLVTAIGSAVSIRHELVGRPFGVSTGMSVERDLTLGLGAALAAPWPMVAASWWAARSDDRRRATRLLACLFLVGALGERATYRALAGQLSPMAASVALGNLVLPALLIAWRGR